MDKEKTYIVTSSANSRMENTVEFVTQDKKKANEVWRECSDERGTKTFIQVWEKEELQYVTREV